METIEVPSITLSIYQSDGNTSFMKIKDKAEIKKIMDFLFQTSFEVCSGVSSGAQSLQDQWSVRLVFEGQQNQFSCIKIMSLLVNQFILLKKNVLFNKLIAGL